jgi:hypothetical protein
MWPKLGRWLRQAGQGRGGCGETGESIYEASKQVCICSRMMRARKGGQRPVSGARRPRLFACTWANPRVQRCLAPAEAHGGRLRNLARTPMLPFRRVKSALLFVRNGSFSDRRDRLVSPRASIRRMERHVAETGALVSASGLGVRGLWRNRRKHIRSWREFL